MFLQLDFRMKAFMLHIVLTVHVFMMGDNREDCVATQGWLFAQIYIS